MRPRADIRLDRSPPVAAGDGRRLASIALALVASGGSWPAAAEAGTTPTLVATVCQACHMPDGNSVVATFPKLAGQTPEYLAKQLADFLGGKRRNDVMAPILSQFTAADIPGLAAFYAGQQATHGIVQDPAVVEAGRKLYEDGNEETGVPGCSGCHQEDGAGDGLFPRLAGQHQGYFVQEMIRFRTGERTNGKFMRAVAERLTDAEIAALAEYLAGL